MKEVCRATVEEGYRTQPDESGLAKNGSLLAKLRFYTECPDSSGDASFDRTEEKTHWGVCSASNSRPSRVTGHIRIHRSSTITSHKTRTRGYGLFKSSRYKPMTNSIKHIQTLLQTLRGNQGLRSMTALKTSGCEIPGILETGSKEAIKQNQGT
ncbi:hypothetical protein P7K49_035369 [Saguinus oedipus]|uniref:Uncharacterized protein n=1 Tax=Saguinus oedipus TaxID=9490 RepID=A0ABQ9TMN4_SAGOE|nr:hypothetical protein P7K49_035369 [Saguinus oedipus]